MIATGACRSASMAGSATLTTDSSTKAMVEPRMVAARIQNFLLATQVGSGRTDRIAASSQGIAFGLITERASLELHAGGLDHLVPALDLRAHIDCGRLRGSADRLARPFGEMGQHFGPAQNLVDVGIDLGDDLRR